MIEDINDMKYVGSTTSKLNRRLSEHRSHKKIGRTDCSSSKLNLYNSIITQLEQCNLEQRKEREKYWINEIDCVNEKKLNGRDKDKQKEYLQNNKDKKKEYDKQYGLKHKEKKKEYLEKNKDKIKQRKRNKYIDRVVKECMDDMINQLLL
tara:strand:+ start:327 stop:776 length:450 start_codon:yes stop_codon:yes gene_type:complete